MADESPVQSKSLGAAVGGLTGAALAIAIEHAIVQSHFAVGDISGAELAAALLSSGGLFGAGVEVALRRWRSQRNAQRLLRYINWVADNEMERDDPALAAEFRSDVARIRGARRASAISVIQQFVETKELFLKLPHEFQGVAAYNDWRALDRKSHGARGAPRSVDKATPRERDVRRGDVVGASRASDPPEEIERARSRSRSRKEV